MKKHNILMIIMLVMSSCQMFLLDSSEWTGPHARKGQADGDTDFELSDIQDRRRVKQQLGGYSIPMPENMVFKYGSTVYGTDKMFGKKRKYLYDNITKTGDSIYLIEEAEKSLPCNPGDCIYTDSKKNGRYRLNARAYGSSGGILIEIKPNLYLACRALEVELASYTANSHCEALVKIMKGQ